MYQGVLGYIQMVAAGAFSECRRFHFVSGRIQGGALFADWGIVANAVTPPVDAPLPEGWAAAKDGQGRTYFWHKTTKKVQWDRPNADTPVS